jgi:pimeloyl-ACP methyl ester carboxylesterase
MSRLSPWRRAAALACGALVFWLGSVGVARAQRYQDLQVPTSPLVLKAQGSFFIGGESVEQTPAQLGGFGEAGTLTINQMYVRYMVPEHADQHAAVVMIHGMSLSGKTWETTPDGRMGWDEYFVRKDRAVYVPDQVSRGRSGFNQAVFNDVRASVIKPAKQPPLMRFSDTIVWANFRFGAKLGVPYADEQFPVTALGELAKQSLPDANAVLPAPNPTYKALSDLAIQARRTVLVSHSQSGAFPLEAALIDPTGIAGMVLVEPGGCPGRYTDAQVATFAKIPILVVFGDHIAETTEGVRAFTWQAPFDGCKAFVARVTAAGGDAQMLSLPEKGVRGNSHVPMQDRNNLKVADLILAWLDEHVDHKQPKK